MNLKEQPGKLPGKDQKIIRSFREEFKKSIVKDIEARKIDVR